MKKGYIKISHRANKRIAKKILDRIEKELRFEFLMRSIFHPNELPF